jgi:hypothetical protein
LSFEGWKFFGVKQGKRVPSDPRSVIKQLRVTADAEEALSKMFENESGKFTERDSVDFVRSPLATLNRQTSVFTVADFSFPAAFLEAIDLVPAWPDLSPTDMVPENMKAVMGAYMRNDVVEKVAFKKLDKTKVLSRDVVWLWWTKETLDVPDGPAVAFPEGLFAVYKDELLFFDSFHVAGGFFDLAQYFREATEEEIDELLTNGPLAWNSERSIHVSVSDKCKRLIYVFNKSGGFKERMTAENIQGRFQEALGIDLDLVTTDDGRTSVALPTQPGKVTELFRLLTDHYYPGIWDDRWRETDSPQIVRESN